MKRPLLSFVLAVAVSALIFNAPTSTQTNGNSTPANAFVNDPCLDPRRPAIERTVQSETDIAVLNDGDGDTGGRLMVAGYNDSAGLYDATKGLSGFSYSTTGGAQWIDAGGLPTASTTDNYFGQPSVAVHHASGTFYYASLYQREPFPAPGFTIGVNRGQFQTAPRQVAVESIADGRCAANPALHGIPNPPAAVRERIIWEPPVPAVTPSSDGFERPWLYVDQVTGVLYLTYTRFGADGSTPVQLVRSFDGGLTWTSPTTIVPSSADTFNQGARAVVTPSGRVVVSWHASRFLGTPEHRIEAAYSDVCQLSTDACTFTAPILVSRVNPQGPPPGDNSGDFTLDNVPSIAVDRGRDDNVITAAEQVSPGFGNVYITYFNGVTPFADPLCDPLDPKKPFCVPYAPAADILLSRSIDNGATYQSPVKVNDDDPAEENEGGDDDDDDGDDDDDDEDIGDDDEYTSHVFPSVQVNQYNDVFVTWLDRRTDDRNLLTTTWGDVSITRGATFGTDGRISTVSADWFVRADYSPNFGTYISSDVVGFTHFISIWADGRFPTPTQSVHGPPPIHRDPEHAATPDVMTGIVRRSAPPPPIVRGCTDPNATNYNPDATVDDGSCTYPPVLGCTDPNATNFNPAATVDDGSCTYPDPDACVAATFALTGDSAASGAPGNERMFTAQGVSVKATAFSRTKSTGSWATAFLGAWSAGLGVTDGSESGNDNTHKVDNLGDRHNYVLLRFSQPVTLTQAFLDAVGADSDATVWIGTIPGAFNAPVMLNDAVLAGLGAPEDSTTTSTQAHWTTFNAAKRSGNVVVIAAQIGGADDAFKLSKLTIGCATPPPPPPCVPITLTLSGDSAATGAPGNVRTFTVDGVSVKASAFSRKESSNAWATAFLGAWSAGLGVTDGSEPGTNNTHKVDNLGDRHNYVLLRFSQPVILTQAYLDEVGADSDASVWIGTIPDAYNGSVTLSDSVLAGLGPREESTTTSTQPHWTSFNAAKRSGNVVVIAAAIDGTNDAFKLSKLKTECATSPPPTEVYDGAVFVVGNEANLSQGARVNFWGAQWAANNPMTGGSATNSFKGFAVGNVNISCGGTWTDRPGNSSKPPETLPAFMPVVVTSKVTKQGSSISGDIVKIVLLRVEPGYGTSPGHGGNGTVVAVLCEAAPATPTLSVWWPTDQAVITGTQAFKARLEGRSLTSYRMYWQVDGDRENPMSDSQADGGHKQAMVTVTGWNWRGKGPYAITFVARDTSGNLIAKRTVSIRIAR